MASEWLGRDATAEADLAEALRRSRLTAQCEKRKRAAADRRSFNVACTLSGLRAELDRREQRRQEAQYAEQLHEAIVQSRQAEEERRARAALNEARDVARAIDASLINHTTLGPAARRCDRAGPRHQAGRAGAA